MTGIFVVLDGTLDPVRDSPKVLWVLMERPGLYNGPTRKDRETSREYSVHRPVFLESPEFILGLLKLLEYS